MTFEKLKTTFQIIMYLGTLISLLSPIFLTVYPKLKLSWLFNIHISLGIGIIGGLLLLVGTILFNFYSSKIDNIKQEEIKQLKIEAGYPQLVPYKSGLLIPQANNTVKIPTIYTEYKNTGKRLAHNVMIRGFVITTDFDIVEHNNTNIDSNPIGAGPNNAYMYYTNIKDLSNFYYVFEISYIDKISNKEFSQAYFYQYNDQNPKSIFFNCEFEQIEKLRNRINTEMNLLGKLDLK